MTHFSAGISAVLAFGALSVTAAAADEAAPVGAPGAQAAAATLSRDTPAPLAGSVTLRKVVCLNVSVQCFPVNRSTADASAKALDLRAPDIRRLVPEAELSRRVEDAYEERERLDENQVRVEGERPSVYLPIGIASLPWAVMHPTQAWRIFLPVPASQAK